MKLDLNKKIWFVLTQMMVIILITKFFHIIYKTVFVFFLTFNEIKKKTIKKNLILFYNG